MKTSFYKNSQGCHGISTDGVGAAVGAAVGAVGTAASAAG